MLELVPAGRSVAWERSIVGTLDAVASMYAVDGARTYALGVSSGGAMAVILGATYPDRFAAIASGEGLEYKAGTSLLGGYIARSDEGPAPATQGALAHDAMGAAARVVATFVVAGDADTTVKPIDAEQTLSQWAQTNDLASGGLDDDNIDDIPEAATNGEVQGGHAYTVSTYSDATTGNVVLPKLTVAGMGHARSGGDAMGSYIDPKGPVRVGWRGSSSRAGRCRSPTTRAQR